MIYVFILTILAFGEGAVVTHINSEITTNTIWRAYDHHLLNGQVHVKAGATLTIEAGTTIKAKYTPAGADSWLNAASTATARHAAALVIEQGAKLNATGTARNPITFTSQNADAWTASTPFGEKIGTWGGVIILGKAPINCHHDIPGHTTAHIEGLEASTSTTRSIDFGGSDANDNSGQLSYVRIWFGGAELSKDNEINGLTLGGVGSGTKIDHIEIAYNQDDGLEIFGGTVDLNYVSLLYNRDDQLDLDCGYQGKIQHVFIAESKGLGDRAHEIDSHDDCDDLTLRAPEAPCASPPRTSPTISQVTILGPGTEETCQHNNDELLLIRGGAGGIYANYIMTYSPSIGQVIAEGSPVPGTITDPLFFHYFYYKVMDVSGIPGGIPITNWDDHCMPTPCTAETDMTRTDAKFDPGLAASSTLVGIEVSGIAGSGSYPGAFAPGQETWLRGWSILDKWNKLETTVVCEAPKTTDLIVAAASHVSLTPTAIVATGLAGLATAACSQF